LEQRQEYAKRLFKHKDDLTDQQQEAIYQGIKWCNIEMLKVLDIDINQFMTEENNTSS
jgi:hypothetical protein